jgi:hypothetical protein
METDILNTIIAFMSFTVNKLVFHIPKLPT